MHCPAGQVLRQPCTRPMQNGLTSLTAGAGGREHLPSSRGSGAPAQKLSTVDAQLEFINPRSRFHRMPALPGTDRDRGRRLAFLPGGLPGLPQRCDHHGEVVVQVIGATVPIPIRREWLDEFAEDHQHCRGVHATIDPDSAGMHGLVDYRRELDHSIKRVLALHNSPEARDLGSLPICVSDHEAPHCGVQALIGGNWLAHVDYSTRGGPHVPGADLADLDNHPALGDLVVLPSLGLRNSFQGPVVPLVGRRPATVALAPLTASFSRPPPAVGARTRWSPSHVHGERKIIRQVIRQVREIRQLP